MTSHQLIQPVISTEAIGNPGPTVHRAGPSAPRQDTSGIRHGVADAARRFRQDLLTSVPLLMADVISLAVCLYSGAALSTLLTGTNIPFGIHKHVAAVSLCYIFIGSQKNLFPAAGINPVFELRQQIVSAALAFVFLLASNGIFGVLHLNEVMTVCFAFPLAAVILPALRFAARYHCANRHWWSQPVVIIGAGKDGSAIYRHFQRMSTRGIRPLGIMDTSPDIHWRDSEPDSPPFLGTLDELESVCRNHNAFTVIAVVSDRSAEETRQIVAECSGFPNLIVLSNRLSLPSLWVGTCDFAGLYGIHIRDRLLYVKAMFLKRLIDIILSLLLLTLTAPLLLTATMMLKFKSPGPAFYGHPRTGRNGTRFKAWKLRTMVPDAGKLFEELMESNPDARREWNETHKLKDDPRIVPGLTRFLRTTSLDELPQLWNVLLGNMSLVGPRPLPDDELEGYHTLPIYFRVRPGLTGLWQISGRNNTQYEDKIRLDTYYIRNWSLWLDYYILLRTIRTVVCREGSY